MSGWDISNIIIGNIIKKLNKYFKYKLFFFSLLKTNAIITIINGFKTSIGWNLGRNIKSSHLFDPFTSTPKIGTKNKKNKQIKKSNLEKKNKFSNFKYDKKNTKNRPINMKIKGLKKNK